MRKLTILLSCVVFMCCSSFNSSSIAAPDEEEALKAMANWYRAYNTSDFELMASLHWNSPKLTRFSPDVAFLMEGWENFGAYWESGLDSPPGTTMNTMHHPHVIMLGDDFAIITSYNTSVYTDPESKEQFVSQVRGTFLFQKIGGKWLIVHEHSSVLPTE